MARLSCVTASLVLIVSSAASAASDRLPRQTFSEVLAKRDTVVIAQRQTEPITHEAGRKGWGQARFQVIDSLKRDSPPENATLLAPCRIEDITGELFLLAGNRDEASGSIRWRLSLPVTEACRRHALDLAELKATETTRLEYFRPLLEHPDPQVSANAHLEFVLATDATFAVARAKLDRKKAGRWLKTQELSDERTRL